MAVDFENRIDDSIEIFSRVDDSLIIDLSSVMAIKVPMPTILQDKFVEPTTNEQVLNADKGYDGLGTITVSAVTPKIDSNIQPENIRKDTEILGVVGTMEAREDLDTELTEQDSLLTELENLVDNFSDKKDLDKEYNLGYAKQLDTIEQITSGRVLVERDYDDKEMEKLEAKLVSLTKGE